MNCDISELAAISMRNQNVVSTKTDATEMMQFRCNKARLAISLTKGVVWIDAMNALFDDLIETKSRQARHLRLYHGRFGNV